MQGFCYKQISPGQKCFSNPCEAWVAIMFLIRVVWQGLSPSARCPWVPSWWTKTCFCQDWCPNHLVKWILETQTSCKAITLWSRLLKKRVVEWHVWVPICHEHIAQWHDGAPISYKHIVESHRKHKHTRTQIHKHMHTNVFPHMQLDRCIYMIHLWSNRDKYYLWFHMLQTNATCCFQTMRNHK